MEESFTVGRTQQMSAIETIRKATFGSADGPPGINRQTISGVASLAESQSQVSNGISVAQSSVNSMRELSTATESQPSGYNQSGQPVTNGSGSIINTQV